MRPRTNFGFHEACSWSFWHLASRDRRHDRFVYKDVNFGRAPPWQQLRKVTKKACQTFFSGAKKLVSQYKEFIGFSMATCSGSLLASSTTSVICSYNWFDSSTFSLSVCDKWLNPSGGDDPF